jgi:ribA/ribD-fused uncharacterized protein
MSPGEDPGPEAARDVEALLDSLGRGERATYLFFWGHRPRADWRPGPSCLSQWFAAPFELGGVRYPTAEHYLMAGKARLFGDDVSARAILATADPAESKQLGRRVRGFSEEKWKRARFRIAVEGNLGKFGQDASLQAYLLSTASQILVEASPRDPIWGIGLARDHPDAAHPERWPGQNLLGFALMEVRTRLAG